MKKILLLMSLVVVLYGCAGAKVTQSVHIPQYNKMSVSEAKQKVLDVLDEYCDDTYMHYIGNVKKDLKGVKSLPNGSVLFIGSPFSSGVALFADSTAYYFAGVNLGSNPKIKVLQNRYEYRDGSVKYNYTVEFVNFRIISGRSKGEPKVSGNNWHIDLVPPDFASKFPPMLNYDKILIYNEESLNRFVSVIISAFPQIEVNK